MQRIPREMSRKYAFDWEDEPPEQAVIPAKSEERSGLVTH